MARPASLSRERIVAAAEQLLERGEGLTARSIADELGCDPAALYRHVVSMDELLRHVGDSVLSGVDTREKADETWQESVVRICRSLRAVHLRRPRVAALVQTAPTRMPNELRITESLLREFRRAGFDDQAAADAYHAVIELTIGSAAIDAGLSTQPASERSAEYARWRRAYSELDTDTHPHSVAVAGRLYKGTADRRFLLALEALVRGLSAA
ncbi:MAG: hypothetical protein RJB65_1533 [Actinomycetota bacterium]|jgi:AcrR family transcriptional regulator